MSISYLIFEVERQRTVAEQREADVRAGELAASITRALRTVKAAVTRLVGGNRRHQPVIPGDDLIPVAALRR